MDHHYHQRIQQRIHPVSHPPTSPIEVLESCIWPAYTHTNLYAGGHRLRPQPLRAPLMAQRARCNLDLVVDGPLLDLGVPSFSRSSGFTAHLRVASSKRQRPSCRCSVATPKVVLLFSLLLCLRRHSVLPSPYSGKGSPPGTIVGAGFHPCCIPSLCDGC
jgi:hypothetical protein